MMKLCSVFLLLIASFAAFPQGLDLELYDKWHGQRQTSLNGAADVFSSSTYPIVIATPIIQALYGLGTKDYKHAAYALQTATGLIINSVLVYGLKHTINRDRPYISHPKYVPDEYDTSPTFPSGHASSAFSTATSVSLQYKRWYIVAPAYIWATGVAYSRVHKGAHYPSDVLAGAVVGAGSAYLSYKVNEWLRVKWKKKLEKRFAE